MALTVLSASINHKNMNESNCMLISLLFYISYINLYLVVTSRIADLVPTVASSWICFAD